MGEGKKKYILGMAKSHLEVEKGDHNGIADAFAKSINPGSSRSLELDFLRLGYAATKLQSEDNEVFAYLMVTTSRMVEKVIKWRDKYCLSEDAVHIVDASLDEEEIRLLVEEKSKNSEANTPKAVDKTKNAQANYSKELIESKLQAFIEKQHADENNHVVINEQPFKVDWDYCKVFNKT